MVTRECPGRNTRCRGVTVLYSIYHSTFYKIRRRLSWMAKGLGLQVSKPFPKMSSEAFLQQHWIGGGIEFRPVRKLSPTLAPKLVIMIYLIDYSKPNSLFLPSHGFMYHCIACALENTYITLFHDAKHQTPLRPLPAFPAANTCSSSPPISQLRYRTARAVAASPAQLTLVILLLTYADLTPSSFSEAPNKGSWYYAVGHSRKPWSIRASCVLRNRLKKYHGPQTTCLMPSYLGERYHGLWQRKHPP